MACACSPSNLGGWGRRITWGQEFEITLGNIVRLSLQKKIFLITQAVKCACSPTYSGGWGRRIAGAHKFQAAVSSATAL